MARATMIAILCNAVLGAQSLKLKHSVGMCPVALPFADSIIVPSQQIHMATHTQRQTNMEMRAKAQKTEEAGELQKRRTDSFSSGKNHYVNAGKKQAPTFADLTQDFSIYDVDGDGCLSGEECGRLQSFFEEEYPVLKGVDWHSFDANADDCLEVDEFMSAAHSLLGTSPAAYALFKSMKAGNNANATAQTSDYSDMEQTLGLKCRECGVPPCQTFSCPNVRPQRTCSSSFGCENCGLACCEKKGRNCCYMDGCFFNDCGPEHCVERTLN